MAGWQGFTDDDIKKMRQSSQSDDPKPTVNSNKKVAATMQQQQKTKRNPGRAPMSDIKSESISDRQTATIDQSMKLSSHERPKEKATTAPASGTNSHHGTRAVKETALSLQTKGAAEKDGSVQQDIGKTEQESNSLNHHQAQPKSHEIKELDEHQVLSAELDNVQKFQQRQKVIEEANKHKRALLAKAIIDRQKKAKAEAAKLMTVQQELNHLDTLLSADVSIIRDKIEMASLEYMDAHKRYERSEKEFIAAKMDLFSKGEVKEHLTEHLYTIIHQNEVRKAKKLVELMEKLAMEVTPEEMELTITAIPQLTNFTAVSTLHDPYHAKNILNAVKEEVDAASAKIASKESKKKQEFENPSPNSVSQPKGISLQAAGSITKQPTNSSATNVESGTHTATANIGIDVHSENNISEIDSPQVPLQQTEILQSNPIIKDTDLNQNIETLTKPASDTDSDSLHISQSILPSPATADSEATPTDSSDLTLQEPQVDGGNTQAQVVSPLSTDKIPSQSDSTELDERSTPANKTNEAKDSSSSIPSGNGWTLPFS